MKVNNLLCVCVRAHAAPAAYSKTVFEVYGLKGVYICFIIISPLVI